MEDYTPRLGASSWRGTCHLESVGMKFTSAHSIGENPDPDPNPDPDRC